jgi:hypothetical protein
MCPLSGAVLLLGVRGEHGELEDGLRQSTDVLRRMLWLTDGPVICGVLLTASECLLSRSGPCDTFVTVVLLFPLPSAPVQVADHIFCARTCRLSSYMEGGCVVRPARRRDRRLLERSSASLRSSSSNSAASEYVWETVAPPRQDDGFFPIYPAWYSSKRRQMCSKKLAMKRLEATGFSIGSLVFCICSC